MVIHNKKFHPDSTTLNFRMEGLRHIRRPIDRQIDEAMRIKNSTANELGLLKLHYLSYARLVRVLSNMEKVYPELKLKSKGVVTPVDRAGLSKGLRGAIAQGHQMIGGTTWGDCSIGILEAYIIF